MRTSMLSFVLAALAATPSMGAQALQSVIGVPVAADSSSSPAAPTEVRVRKVRWTCHDGAATVRGSKECRSISEWREEARIQCKARCAKQYHRDPTTVRKCGVNSFETAVPCT